MAVETLVAEPATAVPVAEPATAVPVAEPATAVPVSTFSGISVLSISLCNFSISFVAFSRSLSNLNFSSVTSSSGIPSGKSSNSENCLSNSSRFNALFKSSI